MAYESDPSSIWELQQNDQHRPGYDFHKSMTPGPSCVPTEALTVIVFAHTGLWSLGQKESLDTRIRHIDRRISFVVQILNVLSAISLKVSIARRSCIRHIIFTAVYIFSDRAFLLKHHHRNSSKPYTHLLHTTKTTISLLVKFLRTRLAILLATLLRWHICAQVS
jgi:hypothetical protein